MKLCHVCCIKAWFQQIIWQACLTGFIQSAAVETPAFTNPAAVLHGVNDLRYEEHALPETVAPGHVRVAIRALGICGSDVHFFKKVWLSVFVCYE